MEMRGKCRRLKAEHGLGVIMIDYMQLMRSDTRSRTIEIRNYPIQSQGRKTLARELKVPAFSAFPKLSRAVETRPGKETAYALF